MTDGTFYGVLGLISLSILAAGFALGWISREENDD